MALAPELSGQIVLLLGRGVARAFGIGAPVIEDSLPRSCSPCERMTHPDDLPDWYCRRHLALRIGTPSPGLGWPRTEACFVGHPLLSAHCRAPEAIDCWAQQILADCHREGIPVAHSYEYACTAIVAPHPSRISHHWNDPLNRAQAESFWAQLVTVLRSRRALSVKDRDRPA
jgi:hypothetical protein